MHMYVYMYLLLISCLPPSILFPRRHKLLLSTMQYLSSYE